MPSPIVFFDIAGPDDAAQRRFYSGLFGWEIAAGGQVRVPVPGGGAMDGALRADPAEKVIYIGVPDITAKLAEIVAAGGKVAYPRFEVPGVVVLGMFLDPAGNRVGLVEMAGDTAKKP
jgi:predicted enzyme related to lactoylglutathione lyase